ncbi:hypothetical protein N566_25985 [Streptomycetaceae bacterium MP113-05]|nr:hypothetical protein N566_25985 [Streptomycetaceae bacterium MP113-05]
MLKAIMRKVEVTGDGVRRGDVVEVGGLLHRVRDVRELRGRRKRLEFEDGNAYVLGPCIVITVARVYDARGVARVRADVHRGHAGNNTLRDDFG